MTAADDVRGILGPPPDPPIDLTRDEALELRSAARYYRDELAKAPNTFTQAIRTLDSAIEKLDELI